MVEPLLWPPMRARPRRRQHRVQVIYANQIPLWECRCGKRWLAADGDKAREHERTNRG